MFCGTYADKGDKVIDKCDDINNSEPKLVETNCGKYFCDLQKWICNTCITSHSINVNSVNANTIQTAKSLRELSIQRYPNDLLVSRNIPITNKLDKETFNRIETNEEISNNVASKLSLTQNEIRSLPFKTPASYTIENKENGRNYPLANPNYNFSNYSVSFYIGEDFNNKCFVLLKTLGRGAFGIVYEAAIEFEHTKYKCALKCNIEPLKEDTNNIDLIALKREINITKNMPQHRNVAYTFGYFIHKNVTFDHIVGINYKYYTWVIQELCDGNTIYHYIKKGVIYSNVIRNNGKKILRTMLKVLEHLRDNKIIHCDIKAENIMIQIDGEEIVSLKLLDFGLSFWKRSITTGLITGTPHYIAPEILISKTYNINTDIWAVLILYFYIILNAYPFHGRNIQDILNNIINKLPYQWKYSDLSTKDQVIIYLRSFMNNDVNYVLTMLEKNPADRYSLVQLICTEGDPALDGRPAKSSWLNWDEGTI